MPNHTVFYRASCIFVPNGRHLMTGIPFFSHGCDIFCQKYQFALQCGTFPSWNISFVTNTSSLPPSIKRWDCFQGIPAFLKIPHTFSKKFVSIILKMTLSPKTGRFSLRNACFSLTERHLLPILGHYLPEIPHFSNPMTWSPGNTAFRHIDDIFH